VIRQITLKFGRAPGCPPETLQATPVIVFVGPNYSGKSKALAEINRYCSSGHKDWSDVIVDEVTFKGLTSNGARHAINSLLLKPNPGEAQQPDRIIIGNRGRRSEVSEQTLLQVLQNPDSARELFCDWYLRLNTLILDGRGRIDLVGGQGGGDLQQPPHSSLQVLFRDDTKRAAVRRIIHDAFSFHFVIDPTGLGSIRIRLSEVAPESAIQERGIHEEAVRFHSAARPIEEASDGVKAFTGIITEVIGGDPSILLIDEPEAFLHPSLAFKLGKEVALATSGSEKRLLVATHSPNFVMGCIQSGAPVTIVRLTYRGNVATARVLPNNDILKLMRNPLLRSTNVLSGLFYEFVVVTESDADRAFYQEINERLLRFKPEWGIPNCLFINAQNKQTVQTIVRPLRELGIPAVGIVDIDALKEGGIVWTGLLSSAFIPGMSHQSLSDLRSAVKKKLEASGRNMKRDGGIELLQGPDKEAANNLLDQLCEYGIFVVRKGELESWQRQLGATGHGPYWLVEAFEKMGEDPEAPNYLKPGDNDVWLFMREIKEWLTDPNRKGIPA